MNASPPQHADWRRSSYSGTNANCVECARLPHTTAVRDSKHPDAGHLAFSATEWSVFLATAKHGAL